MPPILIWAVGALAGAAAVRLAVRQARRVNAELDALRRSGTANVEEAAPAMPRLRRDPRTGTYRPE